MGSRVKDTNVRTVGFHVILRPPASGGTENALPWMVSENMSPWLTELAGGCTLTVLASARPGKINTPHNTPNLNIGDVVDVNILVAPFTDFKNKGSG